MVFHTKVAAVWEFPHEELSARPGLTTVEIMQAAHAGTIKGMYIMAGIAHDRIQREGILWPCPDKAHPGTGTLLLENFNTPGGRAFLFPQPYAPQTEQADAQYPFLLNTGRIFYQYHSCAMSRRSNPLSDYANRSYVLMHTNDAGKLKLKNGVRVKIVSRQGETATRPQTSDEVLTGELFIPFHYSESPVNALTRDELDPDSKIAPFRLTACRVTADDGA